MGMLKPDDQIKVPVRKPLNWNELDDQDPVESAYKVELQTYSDMMKAEHDEMLRAQKPTLSAMEMRQRENFRKSMESARIIADPDVPEGEIYLIDRGMGKTSRNDELTDGLRHMAQMIMMQPPEVNIRANYQGTLQYPDRSTEHRLMHQGPAFGIKPKPKAEVEQVTPKARRVRVAVD
jgi:hypothetical protein